MPDLFHTLNGNDLGFYTIISEAWGIALDAPDASNALRLLVKSLLQPQLFQEMLDILPPEAFGALKTLMENDGRMPWAVFCRRFGALRTIGSGRRDRERPDLHPVSTTETLWYRSLIGKAFLNSPPEPQEYAYIPDEFQDYLQPLIEVESAPLGRLALPAEFACQSLVDDRLIDHACTILAAQRLGMPSDAIAMEHWQIPIAALLSLLRSAELVDESDMPQPEAVRAFLEAPRAQALLQLAHAWLSSLSFNDLRQVPGLDFEGEWINHPLEIRQKMLVWLNRLPPDQWWSLPAFVAAIKEREPDFQRPGGDYDSWFIRRRESTSFLRGFSSWEAVDGALIRFLICGPLHWLGFLDLAGEEAGSEPIAFRFSAWAQDLMHNKPPVGLAGETAQLKANSSGLLHVPSLTLRSARYQIARFCDWQGEISQVYQYVITPASLERARQQGLSSAQLIALLRRLSATALPPVLLQALERWEKFGAQASLGKASLLRVTAPEILTALRKTRASRFLGEALSPTAILIRPGGESAVMAALAESGYLAESQLEV